MEKLWIRWRVRGAEIVYGVDDSALEEISPEAVGCSLREIWMGDDPFSQGQPRISAILFGERLPVKKNRFDLLLRARVYHLPARAVDCQVAIGVLKQED